MIWCTRQRKSHEVCPFDKDSNISVETFPETILTESLVDLYFHHDDDDDDDDDGGGGSKTEELHFEQKEVVPAVMYQPLKKARIERTPNKTLSNDFEIDYGIKNASITFDSNLGFSHSFKSQDDGFSVGFSDIADISPCTLNEELYRTSTPKNILDLVGKNHDTSTILWSSSMITTNDSCDQLMLDNSEDNGKLFTKELSLNTVSHKKTKLLLMDQQLDSQSDSPFSCRMKENKIKSKIFHCQNQLTPKISTIANNTEPLQHNLFKANCTEESSYETVYNENCTEEFFHSSSCKTRKRKFRNKPRKLEMEPKDVSKDFLLDQSNLNQSKSKNFQDSSHPIGSLIIHHVLKTVLPSSNETKNCLDKPDIKTILISRNFVSTFINLLRNINETLHQLFSSDHVNINIINTEVINQFSLKLTTIQLNEVLEDMCRSAFFLISQQMYYQPSYMVLRDLFTEKHKPLNLIELKDLININKNNLCHLTLQKISNTDPSLSMLSLVDDHQICTVNFVQTTETFKESISNIKNQKLENSLIIESEKKLLNIILDMCKIFQNNPALIMLQNCLIINHSNENKLLKMNEPIIFASNNLNIALKAISFLKDFLALIMIKEQENDLESICRKLLAIFSNPTKSDRRSLLDRCQLQYWHNMYNEINGFQEYLVKHSIVCDTDFETSYEMIKYLYNITNRSVFCEDVLEKSEHKKQLQLKLENVYNLSGNSLLPSNNDVFESYTSHRKCLGIDFCQSLYLISNWNQNTENIPTWILHKLMNYHIVSSNNSRLLYSEETIPAVEVIRCNSLRMMVLNELFQKRTINRNKNNHQKKKINSSSNYSLKNNAQASSVSSLTINNPETKLPSGRSTGSEKGNLQNKSFDTKTISNSKNKICSPKEKIINKTDSLLKDCFPHKNIYKDLIDCKYDSLNVENEFIKKDKLEGIESKIISTNMATLKQIGMFTGFSTGSGKRVRVSKKALEEAKLLMNNEMLTENQSFGNVPLNGNSKSVSEEQLSLQNKHNKLNDQHGKNLGTLSGNVSSNLFNNSFQDQVFGGFKTAKGNSVKISNKSLEKAKHVFNDIDEELNKFSSDGEVDLINFSDYLECRIQETSSKLSGAKTGILCEIRALESEKFIPNIEKMEANNENKQNSSILKNLASLQFSSGFTTGSGKKVSVSNESLKASRERFSDAFDDKHCQRSQESFHNMSFGGFSTAAGKQIQVSEKALAKATELLQDDLGSHSQISWDQQDVSESSQAKRSDGLSAEIMETTAAFLADESEDTLNDSSLREFSLTHKEYPQITSNLYREHCKNLEEIIEKKKEGVIRPANGILLNIKLHSQRTTLQAAVGNILPNSFQVKELMQLGISPCILQVTSENAENFVFKREFCLKRELEISPLKLSENTYIAFNEQNVIGKEEFYKSFLAIPSVDPRLVTEKWVFNHFRWIVWKLASMEKSFPLHYGKRYLTVDHVMMQLKLRYDREVDRSERSALKRILERDDAPGKMLILCVASICSNSSSSERKINSESSKIDITLELTDGWYSIPTIIDEPLVNLVKQKKINIGDKLLIYGAELIGPTDACTPLERPADLVLKIRRNSTRRARWHAKLGFYPLPFPFSIPISSIVCNGGLVSCFKAVVARIYPIQYLEKFDGFSVVRNAKSEAEAAAQHELFCQKHYEDIYNQLLQRLETSDSNEPADIPLSSYKKLLEKNKTSASSFDQLLSQTSFTPSQIAVFSEHHYKLQEKKRLEFEAEFQKLLAEKKENGCFPNIRKVTPFMRVLLAGLAPQDCKQQKVCFLTVWRLSDEIIDLLKEGQIFHIINCITSGSWYSTRNTIYLSSTKQTKFIPYTADLQSINACYVPRQVTPISILQDPMFRAAYGEVDVIGIVLLLSKSKNNCETIFLGDISFNFVGLRFWGGCAAYHVEDLIKVETCIAACNLQRKDCNSFNLIPYLDVNDVSTFTSNPKLAHLRDSFNSLNNEIKVLPNYMKLAKDKLAQLLCKNKDLLPGIEIAKSCLFGKSKTSSENKEERRDSYCIKESTLGKEEQNMDTGKTLNKCSLDKSSCSISHIESSTANKSFSTVKRITRLQNFGVAPPLSPIQISSSRNTKKEFKSPFRGIKKAD